jgi:hypothetical protein
MEVVVGNQRRTPRTALLTLAGAVTIPASVVLLVVLETGVVKEVEVIAVGVPRMSFSMEGLVRATQHPMCHMAVVRLLHLTALVLTIGDVRPHLV